MNGSPPRASGAESARPLVRRIIEQTSRFAMLQIVSAGLGWAATIALARLLERRDFGVFGIASFYIGLGNLLGSGGLGATLLRRKGAVSEQEYQSTVTAMLSVAFVCALVLFFVAPWIGVLNDLSDQEVVVLRAMAPLYFVGALRVVPYVRLERELMFAAIARIELSAALIRHLVALSIAASFGSVWALVSSQLASAVAQLVFAYRAAPGWVGLGFSWSRFRPLLAYGSKVQGLTIFAYFKDNVSRSLLGATSGPTAVGIFDFALAYIQIPVVAVNSLARVQFPVYARLEREDPDLFTALRGAMRLALLLGIPLIGMLSVAGPWLIAFVYGDKWLPAVPIAQALVVNMVCGLLTSPLFTLLQAQGRAGLALVAFALWTLTTWALSLSAVALYPGALTLVAAAHSVATLAATAFLLGWASRHVRRRLLPELAPPVIAGLTALAAAVASARYAPAAFAHPAALALELLVAYGVVLVMIDGRRVRTEARALLSMVFRSSRQPTSGRTA